MKEEMLARLVAQAQGQVADMVTIRALIEEASDLGAGRALERLGLSDRGAEQDVRELRELLSAWRDAKKAARGAVIGWIVAVAGALLLVTSAIRISANSIWLYEQLFERKGRQLVLTEFRVAKPPFEECGRIVRI